MINVASKIAVEHSGEGIAMLPERSWVRILSSPTIFMKITLGQLLGKKECPYIKRWVIDFGFFSIRLHHWLSSDDQRYLHDHPWWYISLVVKGSYIDRSDKGDTKRNPGSISYYPATHKHTVSVSSGGCWTILITGREVRDWGFWVKGKFKKRNRYFYDYGHHPCEKG